MGLGTGRQMDMEPEDTASCPQPHTPQDRAGQVPFIVGLCTQNPNMGWTGRAAMGSRHHRHLVGASSIQSWVWGLLRSWLSTVHTPHAGLHVCVLNTPGAGWGSWGSSQGTCR